jgi:uncharacterized metal-binding protein
MASGRTHNATSTLAACVFAGLAIKQLDPNLAIAAGGCLFGIFAGPDEDQETVTKAEWDLVKSLPVLGWLWVAIWDIYARLFEHRAFASHAPVVSTLIRLAYLILELQLGRLLLWRVSVALGYEIDVSFSLAWLAKPWLFWFTCGWAASDTLHWLLDGCPLKVKVYKGKRIKRRAKRRRKRGRQWAFALEKLATYVAVLNGL